MARSAAGSGSSIEIEIKRRQIQKDIYIYHMLYVICLSAITSLLLLNETQ